MSTGDPGSDALTRWDDSGVFGAAGAGSGGSVADQTSPTGPHGEPMMYDEVANPYWLDAAGHRIYMTADDSAGVADGQQASGADTGGSTVTLPATGTGGGGDVVQTQQAFGAGTNVDQTPPTGLHGEPVMYDEVANPYWLDAAGHRIYMPTDDDGGSAGTQQAFGAGPGGSTVDPQATSGDVTFHGLDHGSGGSNLDSPLTSGGDENGGGILENPQQSGAGHGGSTVTEQSEPATHHERSDAFDGHDSSGGHEAEGHEAATSSHDDVGSADSHDIDA